MRGGEGGKVKDLHTLKIGSNLDSFIYFLFYFFIGFNFIKPGLGVNLDSFTYCVSSLLKLCLSFLYLMIIPYSYLFL